MNRYWGYEVDLEEGEPMLPPNGYPHVLKRYDQGQTTRREIVTQGRRDIILVRQGTTRKKTVPPRPDSMQLPPPVHSRTTAPVTDAPPEPQHASASTGVQHRDMPWYLAVGLGAALVLTVVGLFSPGSTLWQSYQDNVHYGYPRTYQIDAVVGHHDSAAHPSHFIALNLHGHVEVIELPAGDATHLLVYEGPPLMGPGADLAPVTMQFKDVNGDGRPDLLIYVQSEVLVYLNDPASGRFRPQQSSDHITLAP